MAGFHAGMVSVLRTGLQDEKAARWVAKTLSADPRWDDPLPSLARRVENIGHLHARMDALAGESAAAVYLGAAPGRRHGSQDREEEASDGVEWPRHCWLWITRLAQRLADRLKKLHGDAATVHGD